jgi:hypothetical protein
MLRYLANRTKPMRESVAPASHCSAAMPGQPRTHHFPATCFPDKDQAGSNRDWFQYGRRWIAHCAVRVSAGHVPPLEATSQNFRGNLALAAGIPVKLAAIHLRNGQECVFAVDAQNEAHLDYCLKRSRDTSRVAWFKTVDECLVALNLSQLNAVVWYRPGPVAPKCTAWERRQFTAHFADRATIALQQISSTAIERLREATLSKRGVTAFHLLKGRQDDPVSISIENMTCITMPAAWLCRDA